MITHKFNNKQRLRLVKTTGDSPLNLNQRLAYSALLTDEKGLSQEGVSSLTGLDAKGTVAAALKALVKDGLAERLGGRWVAIEPAGDRHKWFTTSIKEKDWRRRFDYSKLYRLAGDCPLTLKQGVVYSMLLSLARNSVKRQDLPQGSRGRVCDGLTYEYLSLLTGVGVKTVRGTIDLLDDLKLAKFFPSTLRSRFALVLLDPTDEVLTWFEDKGAESYPGLIEYLDGRQPLVASDDLTLADEGSDPKPPLDGLVGHRKAAKRSKSIASAFASVPEQLPECPQQRDEPEILPTIPESRSGSGDVIEILRAQAAELRRDQEREIEAILLGFGYAEKVVATLGRSFDRPGLPTFDDFKGMIHDAEATFRRNKAEGKYSSVRTSELLLVKWLDNHRREAVEGLDRFIEAHDHRAWKQRLSNIKRPALERPWEDYDDPMTAPFDARLFAERIDGGEIGWDGWGRDYGQDVCRRALVGLVRVPIDGLLIEPGRIEPEDFERRLRSIAPPRSVVRKPTEEEMYEALRAEMSAA